MKRQKAFNKLERTLQHLLSKLVLKIKYSGAAVKILPNIIKICQNINIGWNSGLAVKKLECILTFIVQTRFKNNFKTLNT